MNCESRIRRARVVAVVAAAGLSVVASAADKGKAPEAAKPAEGAKAPEAAQPALTSPAAAEMPERVIEKKDGEHSFRVTLRPGNLKLNRVADVSVEIVRVLDIPDPQLGDRIPVSAIDPVASVQGPAAPAPEPAKGRKPAAPETPEKQVIQLFPLGPPGTYGFHFTPTVDGIYEVTFGGQDPRTESETPAKLATTFRLGAGSAAAQTEQSQGSGAARRSARRPVGGTNERAGEEKLTRLMEEIGNRYLDLEAMLGKPPAKGPHADAAAEARALASLFGQAKGLAPKAYAAGANEFDKLSMLSAEKLEAVAKGAEDPKNRELARTAFAEVTSQSCYQCHAKYWYGVTTDLSAWPKFEQKPWKK